MFYPNSFSMELEDLTATEKRNSLFIQKNQNTFFTKGPVFKQLKNCNRNCEWGIAIYEFIFILLFND